MTDKPPKAEVKTFIDSATALLQLGMEMHDQLYPGASSRHTWAVWSNKFLTLISNTDKGKLDNLRDVFLRFYTKMSDEIAMPIFSGVNDDKVNDGWLKDMGVKPGPGFSEPGSSKSEGNKDGWSLGSIRPKGYVIYFNENNLATRAVAVPIGEIYQAAIKLHIEKGSKDAACMAYPLKVLYYLYHIMNEVVPSVDPKKKQVSANFSKINDALSSISDEGATDSGGTQGFTKLFSNILKQAGMSGNIDEKSVGNIINTVANKDTMSGIGQLVSTVTKAVDLGDGKQPVDLGKVLTSLGGALQNPDVQEAAKKTALSAQKSIAELQATVPTAATLPIIVETPGGSQPTGDKLPIPQETSFNPADQE